MEPQEDTEKRTILDDDTRHAVAMLRSRSRSLREQAPTLVEPVATTYRRRARELELEAFLLENRASIPAA
jgi:hypothetical protein